METKVPDQLTDMEKVIAALRYIQSCDNATQSAKKAIETLKEIKAW